MFVPRLANHTFKSGITAEAYQLFTGAYAFYIATSAKIAPGSTVHADVEPYVSIGSNTVVEVGVAIGFGTRIASWSKVQAGTIIHPFCVIGEDVFIGMNCLIERASRIPNSTHIRDGFRIVRQPEIRRRLALAPLLQ